jgi:hypothetical protein
LSILDPLAVNQAIARSSSMRLTETLFPRQNLSQIEVRKEIPTQYRILHATQKQTKKAQNPSHNRTERIPSLQSSKFHQNPDLLLFRSSKANSQTCLSVCLKPLKHNKKNSNPLTSFHNYYCLIESSLSLATLSSKNLPKPLHHDDNRKKKKKQKKKMMDV